MSELFLCAPQILPIPATAPTRAAVMRLARRGAAPSDGAARATAIDAYLVGTAYSGTTHLGGLLAANLGAFYAGELGRIPGFADRYGLFQDSVGCLQCAGSDEQCPVWTDALLEEAGRDTPTAGMRAVRDHVQQPVVIDGSKFPRWLQEGIESREPGDARIVALITVRSPFSYAKSVIGATGRPMRMALSGWRDTYVDAIRIATRAQIPLFVVRNEEVRSAPEVVLDRLAPVLGWPHRIGHLVPAAPTHSIGGNAFVQAGFGSEGRAALARLGLLRGENDWDPKDAAIAQQTQSASFLHGPGSGDAAREWARAATECAGLMSVAQTLGYDMSREMERLVVDSER